MIFCCLGIVLCGILIPLFCWIYKLIVTFFIKHVLGIPVVQAIEANDLMFINDKFNSRPCNTIVVVCTLKGRPEKERIFQDLQRESKRFWKLRCFPVNYGGYWFWENVPKFKVENQVQFVKLLDPSRWEDETSSIIENLYRRPFPNKSPIWDLTIAEGKGKSLAIFRASHALLDGYSFVKFKARLGGLEGLPSELQIPSSKSDTSRLQFLKALVMEGIPRSASIYRSLPEKNSITWWGIYLYPLQVSGNWSVGISEKINLSDITQARRKFGASFYAVMLSAVMRGLAKFVIRYYGYDELPKSIKSVYPIGKPDTPPDVLCNHWNPMVADLPMADLVDMDIPSTITNVDKALKSSLTSTCSTVGEMGFRLLSLLPVGNYIERISNFQGMTLQTSIARTFTSHPPMFGEEVEECFHLTPIIRERLAAIAWSCVSCNGTLRITVTAEQCFLPFGVNAKDIANFFFNELKEIVQLAKSE